MKLRFDWKSGHLRLELTQILATGSPVEVLNNKGKPRWLPMVVTNGQAVTVDRRYVAYGGAPTWEVMVRNRAVTGKALVGLTITAVYDDTIESDRTDILAEQKEVPAGGEMKSFTKQLQIPDERPA